MDFHLPIEQLVRRRDTRFQLGFAREARSLVPENEDFRLFPLDVGLRIVAKNEDRLAQPVAILREAFGDALDVDVPLARLIAGSQVKEPVMHLRITLPSRFRETVKRALLARGTSALDEYVRPTHSVLRYEAPLANLLGFPSELAQLTGGTARHWMLLSHYALVIGDPGGQAA
jgi:hypothetical protein